jgi:hypothetical protein
MPAIAPLFMMCTNYMYRSRDAAESGLQSGGTGVFVSITEAGLTWVYAVTNKHVVDSGHRGIRYTNAMGATAFLETAVEDWEISPDDDLAVCEPAIGDAQPPQHVPTTLFLEKDQRINGWSVYPGDDVYLFSRFVTHDGRQRNAPVLRFGSIAMLASESDPIRVGDQDQVGYLVECRSLSGASGSPAFVYLASSRLAAPDEPKGWIKSEFRLLGINCAHLPFWSRVYDGKDRTRRTQYWADDNSGIAVVIPAWRLLGLLQAERFVVRRSAEIQQRRAATYRLALRPLTSSLPSPY